MGSSPAAGVVLPADEAAAGDVGKRRRLAIAQREIDVLSPSRFRPAQKRSHDAVRRVQAGREIRHGDADLNGRAVAAARDVHQAEFGLDHDIVPCALGVRTRLAVASD